MSYKPFSRDHLTAEQDYKRRPTTSMQTAQQQRQKNVVVCEHDLPPLDTLELSDSVAIDTEAMGLKTHRDRLCLVQLTFGNGGPIYLVRVRGNGSSSRFQDAPNLKTILEAQNITKIFHFGRFDIALLYQCYGVLTAPIYCTKIASFLARTYTDRHGLKELCRELLGVEMSKYEQTSDWGKDEALTDDQIAYAAADVRYLHALRNHLNTMLTRENRWHLLAPCLEFLPHQARLDVEGWNEYDIFSHLGNKKI